MATRTAPRRIGKKAQMDLFGASSGRKGASTRRAAKPKPKPRSKAGATRGARSRKAAAKAGARAASKRGAAGNGKTPKSVAVPQPATEIQAVAEVASKDMPTNGRRLSAEKMAKKQREISVSEFFTKNRHLLGFDNPVKALLTATKEAVDNSLDACEEAGILPDIEVSVEELAEDRFRLTVTDNGPGIVKKQIPKIFGKLLYGSKFHSLKQSRGQQGIGISAAGMYSQLTTGKPVHIISRTDRKKEAHHYEITVDTAKNEPHIVHEDIVEWDKDHGTRVSMELAGVYKKGRRSLDDYVSHSALSNLHSTFRYRSPKGEEYLYERGTKELPKEPMAIKPHPYGVELGILIRMMKETRSRSVAGTLQSDFSRVSPKVAGEICAAAGIRPNARPKGLKPGEVERLFRAIPKVKIMAPPTNCLSPIGAEKIESALQKHIQADFAAAVTRSPSVYRGNPFQIEVGLAYGGDLPAEDLVDLWRFANRVPLQYQQSACAISKAAVATDWKKYGMSQSRGALPSGQMIVAVHIASVWVPFTSESKEAVASYPEIIKEIRLGLMECGRKLGAYLSRKRRLADAEKKKSYIESYIPHIGIALREILGFSAREEAKVVSTLTDTLERSRKI